MLSVPSCQNSFYMHHSTHRWPVVMAAGTSEPDLAETSSPPSGTHGGLSWGDIQPEPTVADNCGDCGKGLAIMIYWPAAPLLLHVVRCLNSIVINHQENYEHANEFPYLIRQSKEEINLLELMSFIRLLLLTCVSSRECKYNRAFPCVLHFCYYPLQEDLMESSSDEESGLQDEKNSASLLDMEDLGTIMKRAKKAKVRFQWLFRLISIYSWEPFLI